MIPRAYLALASFVSLAAAGTLAACSGSDTTTPPGADAGTDATQNQDSGSDGAAQDAAVDAPVATDGSNADGGDDCSKLAKAQCQQCCIQAHPNVVILQTEAIKCACQTPGLCKTDCAATLCAQKGADQTCSACIQSADAGNCLQQAAAACASDNDCAQGIQCGQGCK
ncbi:hypothetical protein BH09MYX1_BH09MYX1_50550 [soil metagenome]